MSYREQNVKVTMKVCKSCGTELESSFSLGSKCPNCKIKIVYEEFSPISLFSKIKGYFENFAVFIGIAIIIFIIGNLIYLPFNLYFRHQETDAINQYHLIISDMERSLLLDGSQQSISELEEYVGRHIEKFELFADNPKVLEGLLFSSVHSMEEKYNARGTAAVYIFINKDRFTKKEFVELFDQIGFYDQANTKYINPALLEHLQETNITK